MARRTFFSFHYRADVSRAWVVKNSQIVKDREDAGFLDSSAFEKAQNENPESLKRFLRKEMEGSSVVCALVGAETAIRPWVRFELLQALWDGRGLLAIRVHSIQDLNRKVATIGANPFDLLGVYVVENKMYLIERVSTIAQWAYTIHFQQQMLPKWAYGQVLPTPGMHALSEFFPTHEWTANAHSQIGTWIEYAALAAGR